MLKKKEKKDSAFQLIAETDKYICMCTCVYNGGDVISACLYGQVNTQIHEREQIHAWEVTECTNTYIRIELVISGI